MTAARRDSGPNIEPFEMVTREVSDLRTRVAQLDGNEHDKGGGRMGRLEAEVSEIKRSNSKAMAMLILTLLGTIGTLATTLFAIATRK